MISTHVRRPPSRITTMAVNRKVKNCCRNSASTVEKRILYPLNVVHDGRQQRAGRILLEKCHRAPQGRGVKFVAQVGDHAVIRHSSPGRCRRNRTGLSAGGNDQSEGDHSPDIMEVLGNKAAQFDWLPGDRHAEKGKRSAPATMDSAPGRGWGRSAATGRHQAVPPAPSRRPRRPDRTNTA